MSNIQNPPATVTDAGLSFNYALWTAGTEITLCNVPWNNDYRDILAPDTDVNDYIDDNIASSIVIDNLSYVKPNQPVRINIPINRALKYNYLRASNSVQPIPGTDELKQFYYFILDAKYLAPNTTELILQLDVWQTYKNQVQFGNCYVERGHIGIANENAFDNYGRDYLTVPEGLDIGNEYMVVTKKYENILDASGGETLTKNPHVLVCSATNLLADPGDVDNPNLEAANGSVFNGIPSGAEFYIIAGNNLKAFMASKAGTPWVTQGIISLTIIPPITRYFPSFTFSTDNYTLTVAPESYPSSVEHNMFSDWRDSSDLLNYFPERYRHLRKFWTFPYMVIEMTTNSGTPTIIKPEAWNDPDASIIERPALIPPNQRIVFFPRHYNEDDYSFEVSINAHDDGEYLDVITHVANFPSIPIVNNGAISYLAANANSIAYGYSSAEWTQQRALGSAQTSYDQATAAADVLRQLTNIGINADASQTANINRTLGTQAIYNSLAGLGGGAGSGAVFGPVGAAAGALGGSVSGIAGNLSALTQQGANNEAFAIRNSQELQNLDVNKTQAEYLRDTNKGLADWAAKGDYANALNAVNARVQDANMIQPSTAGQFGGEALNFIHGSLALFLKWKMPDQATIRRIGELWLRYGYAIRAFITPPESLMVMEKFTYWKLSETYLVNTNIPEQYKQVIRGIFEKGVTVWANPSDIGNIDIADNDILSGVSY